MPRLSLPRPVRSRLRRCAYAALLWLCGIGIGMGVAVAQPQRIVSFNLCADQLVLALADRSQIASLSPFASDPELSVMAKEAQGVAHLPQRAEAAVALRPDLVLAGAIDRAGLRHTLVRAGLRVVEVELIADIAQARAQARAVAALVGQPARGEALVRAIDAARARLHAAVAGRTQTALLVERAGYVTGPASLAGALLREAGFVAPAGAPGGLGGFVPLEKLLLLHPQRLGLYERVHGASDQGTLFLAHPALRALYPPERQFVLPQKFALCGGPALVAALDYLTRLVSARGME
ncbi:MAG: ABC transporter substrate-binding protein [Variibacter sp.]|nr:ABC transporter substrate-binding protein [Variibacter sp.]